MAGPDRAMTYSEVALRLGCSERHVFRLVRDGKLTPQPKRDGQRRILQSEVDRYVIERYRLGLAADDEQDTG
jgi:excisionase family DNA binding protein